MSENDNKQTSSSNFLNITILFQNSLSAESEDSHASPSDNTKFLNLSKRLKQ